jgi:hypothetical protein
MMTCPNAGFITAAPRVSRVIFGFDFNRWDDYRILSDQTIIRHPDCVFSFQADLKERKGPVVSANGPVSELSN